MDSVHHTPAPYGSRAILLGVVLFLIICAVIEVARQQGWVS